MEKGGIKTFIEWILFFFLLRKKISMGILAPISLACFVLIRPNSSLQGRIYSSNSYVIYFCLGNSGRNLTLPWVAFLCSEIKLNPILIQVLAKLIMNV